MHVPEVRDFFFMVDLLVSLNTWRIGVGSQQAPCLSDPHLTLVHACSNSPWLLLWPQVAPMDPGGIFWQQASGELLRIQPSAHPSTCRGPRHPVDFCTPRLPCHSGASQLLWTLGSSCGPRFPTSPHEPRIQVGPCEPRLMSSLSTRPIPQNQRLGWSLCTLVPGLPTCWSRHQTFLP